MSNMGNHSATVYPGAANGDTAPLRTIRSAPAGKLALAIGNPGAVAYDTKTGRSAGAELSGPPADCGLRQAGEGKRQARRLDRRTKTLLSRTMHDIRYDAVHDEDLVTNPFAQAILVFRGEARRRRGPVRIIQGPSHANIEFDRLEVDPVTTRFSSRTMTALSVLPRDANGDAARSPSTRGPATHRQERPIGGRRSSS